jgi:TM2 domain-containing membrane protein YozV
LEAEEEIEEKNATKAMLLSLFVPGGGQFYNDKYIKGGIEAAGEAILIGYTIHYHNKMNDAYSLYEQTGLETDYDSYNSYYEKRQNMFWWLGALKFVSVVDAFIDAKLYNYEQKKKSIELRFEGMSVALEYRF